MKLNEVTAEIKEKMYNAKTIDEFMKVAEENGIEVSREEAEKLYHVGPKKLSDDELETVSAGHGHFSIRCGNCLNYFWADDQEYKTITYGCDQSYCLWKCPHCGKWVWNNGDVEE